MISSPELVKKFTPTITAARSRVDIQFEFAPSEFSINQGLDSGVKNVALELGNMFTLPQEKGVYVFDVYGHWKESSFAFSVEVK